MATRLLLGRSPFCREPLPVPPLHQCRTRCRQVEPEGVTRIRAYARVARWGLVLDYLKSPRRDRICGTGRVAIVTGGHGRVLSTTYHEPERMAAREGAAGIYREVEWCARRVRVAGLRSS